MSIAVGLISILLILFKPKLVVAFLEDNSDVGAFTNRLIITVLDDEIKDTDLNRFMRVDGLPTGLKANFNKLSDNQILLFLTGNALSHRPDNNTTININFAADMFESGTGS